jgi:glucosamine--fructose-6-phosphate aminotransferase (isomerizing)
MCGIFVYIGTRDDAPRIAFDGIKLLEYRGYDSWGVGYIPKKSDKKIIYEKHTGKIGNAKLKKFSPSNIAFAHTRWATHGGVTDLNAHPHLDCRGQIAVIHNGIVENYKELKVDLIKKGHKFKSETDTEIITHLVEEYAKKQSFGKAVFSAFKNLAGSNAICVMDLINETVVACRNGSPLVAGLDTKNNQFFLGSDVPAFLKYTNRVYFLNDNEAVTLTKSGVKLFDVKSGKEKTIKTKVLDWKLEDAEKSGYPHFLIKEIHEQKSTMVKAAVGNLPQIRKVARLIRSGYKVIFTGCGSAAYCSLLGKHFLAEAGIESQAYGAYEFLPFARFCNKETVVIGISQSGETADTLIALKAAKIKGAHIVSVVNAKGTTMERLSDTVIFVGAGPEIAVVSTKAFTSQVVTAYLISKAVKNKLKPAVAEIKKFCAGLEKFLDKKLERRIIKMAKELSNKEHIYLIGKHANYPAAMEFALKIKESAYIHSEAFTAGELKHGVITLIQKGVPCFILASNDDVKDEVLSSAAELKARGGRIIGIAPFNSPEFDENIPTPDAGELTIFGNVIVGQLLGYYLSTVLGNDPDKPRNLAKSVTVK